MQHLQVRFNVFQNTQQQCHVCPAAALFSEAWRVMLQHELNYWCEAKKAVVDTTLRREEQCEESAIDSIVLALYVEAYWVI